MSADFTGLAVALATPFGADGRLDLAAYRRIVRHVARGGVDTLVALGSTGEASTLDDDERELLVQVCLEEAQGRQVLVGAGSNNTRRAAGWARRAQELGASGVLVVVPYYNKPTPRGIVMHFRAIAEAAPGLPIVAYNVQGRTGTNLTPETLGALWELDEVVAVKESSGNLGQISAICAELPRDKTVLAGDDHLALATLAVGGSGLVSVAANLVPLEVAALVTAAREGQLAVARALHARLAPLFDALFVESNPIPLKAGLTHLGLAEDHLRLPLTRPEPSTRARIVEALARIG